MKNHQFYESEFYCTQCGSKGIPVQRKIGQEREAGHLKKLFCLKCKKDQNHVECRQWTKYSHDDFLVEMKYHNFDNDGKRIRTYGELKELINNGKM